MTGRKRAGALLLVLALGALLYLPGLGREMLRHPLESKYALAAREMLRGGPRLVAHLFGEIYPDKPPLYFWSVAGVAWVQGGRLDEVAARLPAVGGALVTLGVTFALGQALYGRRAGLTAAAVLATSGLFYWYARQGHPDQFLTAAVAIACLGLWRSFSAASPGRRTAWIVVAYAAMGVGVLSKGLLGFLIPLLAAGAYLAATGPLRAVPRRLGLWPGLPVGLAVVLGWYGPAVAQYGVAYLRETIVHQQIERYTRTWVHRAPWYYYVPEFTAGFLPWSLFLPGALALGWRAWRGRRPLDAPPAREDGNAPADEAAAWVFPAGWLATGFVFFSLTRGKRGAYLLPLYPAAALLVAWLWTRAGARRSRWVGIPIALLSGGATLLAVAVLVVPRSLIPGTMVDTLVPAAPLWKVATAGTLLAGAVTVWAAWRRGRAGAALVAIVAVQALCLHVVSAVRAPQYEARYPVRALAADIRARVPAGETLLSLLGDYNFLVAFYLDRPLAPLPGPSELLAARGRTPRYALVDARERAVLDAPGVHPLAEARLGPKRIVVVRLDPPPG